MSLNKLNFTKDWTNPADFPTVEMTEEKVRADQQFLFNEIKTFLNDTLIPEIASEITAACQGIVLGQITDGSVTKAKLAAAVADAVTRAEVGGELDKKLAGITLSGLGAVAKTGDTMTGNLTIKTAAVPAINFDSDGGTSRVFKNASAVVEDGTHIQDQDNNGNTASLILRGASGLDNCLAVNLNGALHQVLHTGNFSDFGVPKIEAGSYVGTGTSGEDNKNTLTFGFVPKVVFIVPDTETQERGNGLILMQGASLFGGFGTFYSTTGTVLRNSVSISWSEKTVSWYSYGDYENAVAQQNDSGVTYRYIAFC